MFNVGGGWGQRAELRNRKEHEGGGVDKLFSNRAKLARG
jgi:hypothetical protein